MATRVEALVTPALLRWGRDTAGYDVPTAAAKANVKPEALESWEAGQAKPSIPQLRKLANIYKRPIAVFYLPEPPQGFTVPKDYRRSADTGGLPPSPTLLFQLREAQAKRELFLELYQQTEGTPPSLTLSANMKEDPEVVGQRIRSYLGVPVEAQEDWGPRHDTLNRWRSAFEQVGVLVFQMQDVPWGDARGFSIFFDTLPLAVTNVKDSPNGRIFTMFHELAHIALRQGGICDLEESGGRLSDLNDVEVFCNAVAGAVLIPREHLLQDDIVRTHSGGHKWRDSDIGRMAGKFRCSREVVLRRLLTHGRVTQEFYQHKREQFAREVLDQRRTQHSGPVPPPRKALASFGQFFVRVVLDNYYRDNITGSDLSDLLRLRMKHLPKLEAMLGNARIREVNA